MTYLLFNELMYSELSGGLGIDTVFANGPPLYSTAFA